MAANQICKINDEANEMSVREDNSEERFKVYFAIQIIAQESQTKHQIAKSIADFDSQIESCKNKMETLDSDQTKGQGQSI